MGLNDRDRGLLAWFGMTEEQVECDAAMAESETEPDDLNGRVHYGPHLDKPDEETAGADIRPPESTVDAPDNTAKRHHTVHSE